MVTEVACRFAGSDHVGVWGRGARTEVSTERQGEVDPFGGVLVAVAGIDLHAPQSRGGNDMTCCQWVVLEHQQAERLVAERPARQLRGQREGQACGTAEGDIEPAGQQPGKRGAHPASVPDGELLARCHLPGGLDHASRRQALTDDVGEHRTGRPSEVAQGGVVESEQAAGVDEQTFAVGGQGDAAGAPHEQPSTELGLQTPDVPAQRLLGDIQPLRRAREVQLFGDDDKGTQKAEVELGPHNDHGTAARRGIDTACGSVPRREPTEAFTDICCQSRLYRCWT